MHIKLSNKQKSSSTSLVSFDRFGNLHPFLFLIESVILYVQLRFICVSIQTNCFTFIPDYIELICNTYFNVTSTQHADH